MKIACLALLALTAATLISAQSPAVVPSGCTNMPQPSATADLPFLMTSMSGFIAANQFTLVVRSLMVNNRSDATITLKAGADDCNYPSPSTPWVKSYVGCYEEWTANIAWTTLSNDCGLSKTIDPSKTVFDGSISVSQTELLDPIRGTAISRQLDTSLSYEITFPTVVSLNSSDVEVFSPIDVLASVTKDDYNSNLAVGEVDLFTSVQYPFELSGASISIVSPAGSTITPSIASVSTNCPASQPCEVTYHLQLTPNGVCSLNGTYRLSFAFACNPAYNQSDCPVQSESGHIDFTIVGQDLCGQFGEHVQLDGTLVSYLDNTYAQQRNAFIIGQVAYFEASLTSDVSIIGSSITNVASSYNNQADVVLYTGGAATGTGTSLNYGVDTQGDPTIQRFHFDVQPAVFPVTTDSSGSAVVKVTLSVQFYNTTKRDIVFHMAAKRQQGRVQSVVASTLVQVQQPQQQPQPTAPTTSGNGNNNNGSTLPTSTLATVIALAAVVVIAVAGICGLVAFMMMKRRRQNSSNNNNNSNASNSNVSI